ncbi:hypothetical protein [Streptomyces sp. NPDC048425]|uniref:hypothetical protein n=1 Tax=Streptomyces sp. NPDC048425 TaxID=3365548 RepID=UPI00371BA281
MRKASRSEGGRFRRTRQALAPQMNYLMSAGCYPNCQRHGLGAAHKGAPAWEFGRGLDCILYGIAARPGV